MKSLRNKFYCAIRGIGLALKDRSILLQFLLMIIVFIFFHFLGLSLWEWCLIIGCCAFVITAEIVNTIIERIMDYLSLEYDEKIRYIKDLSAGMVLIAAMFALVIALLIVGGKI